MDKWLLSKLNTVIGAVDDNLGSYKIPEAARALDEFVDDMSNWYVRRSRERFWAKGTADMILGFEPGETVRMLPYLKKNGAVVVSNRAVMPVTASLAKTGYNGASMIDYLKTQVDQVLVIDTDQACETLGSAKVLNVLMLGAAISTGMLGLEKEDIKQALIKRLPEKLHELNFRALDYIQ